ncbi:MAG TPA: DUF6089 family protein [Bacteroidia bacterium]|jgi:hypothetical protein|nr:DUF6089 family protein [Bacteroidia bacterium]
MKKLFVLFVGLVLYTPTLFAQRNLELGGFLGCSFYIGELNPNGYFDQFTHIAAGAVARYTLNNRLAVRANLFFGEVSGDDSQSKSASQRERNLNFQSPIDELSVQAEFNFLEYELGDPKHSFSPYIFAGAGVFKMNPEGLVGSNWVPLQPLGTEGQGTAANTTKPYSLIQPSIPFGLGIKANFSKTICISVEWGMRKTFTGYIDDVSKTYVDPSVLLANRGLNGAMAVTMADRSLTADKAADVGEQRGNGKDDWYSFAGIVLSFRIRMHSRPCASYN